MMITLRNIAENFDIPLVKAIDINTNLSDAIKYVESFSELKEGLVCRYELNNDSTYFVKIKNAEYVKIHSLISTIVDDKKLVRIIFEEKLDDVIPVIKNEKLKEAIIKYENDLSEKAFNFVKDLVDFYNNAIEQISEEIDTKTRKKIFATQFVIRKKNMQALLYSLWEKGKMQKVTLEDGLELLKTSFLKLVTNNKKFEEFRQLLGLELFEKYYYYVEEN